MLPRKRNVPAEPAANPFALSRPQQISVSDEITAVKQAPPSLVPPPLPSRATAAASSRRMPAARVAPPPRVGPPPIPRELPRASFIPPSPEDFERASSRNGLPAVSEPPPSSKPQSSDAIEPMAITHHPPALVAGQRPSASWAMALLALGVFGGVVTAIIAGGDTETILRAGAKFIDPASPQAPVTAAAAAPAQVPSTTVPPYVEPARAAPPAPVAAVAAVEERPADKRDAKPEPKPEPKASPRETAALIAAIQPIRSVKTEAKPREAKPEPKPAPKVAWTPPPRRAEPPAPKPEPKPAAKAAAPSAEEELAQAPAPKKRGKDDAAAAAAAANALAKAQLEGSL